MSIVRRRQLPRPVLSLLLLSLLVPPVAAAGSPVPAGAEPAVGAPSQEEPQDPNVIVDPHWLEEISYRLVGPTRGGRSTAVSGVPGEPFSFYMGTTGGGVWKTHNAGQTWENVSDGDFGVGSIGAVAVADSDVNVVWVGTGSACPRGNVSIGDGVYRSTDAGRSWLHVGLPDAGLIGRIRVHPDNPDVAWVAALGNIFGPNPERGVYRTRDGGASWEQVLFVSERTGVVDLALNPANPRILFAAAWTAERKPWTLIDGGEESGLFRSRDGGDSWERLEGGLPEGPLGRIGVTVSPANPDRVWALVTADRRGGIYRSDDGGDSWRLISENRELQTRGWYYSHITADPVDADTVYVMNGGFFRSIDGGREWERVRTPHGDNHDMWINPEDPKIFVEANDGGAAVTLDGGETWTTQLNQPTAEFYRVTVDDQYPYRLYGAQQDNSTISVPSRPASTIIPFDWYVVGGGESGHIAVKPGDPSTVFAGNYIGQIDRFDRDSGHSANVVIYPQMQDGTAPRDLRYRFQWNAPILFSQHDPEVVYHTSNFVHRTRDGGQSWETISPDLTTDNAEQQELPGGPIQHDHTGVEVYNTIFALAESPRDGAELWAGSDDGRLHVTRDGGGSWADITPEGLPAGATINSIDLSAHRDGRATVAAYRYRDNDFRPYVFRTDDWGTTWRSLASGDNGIPADHPVRVVREDPDREGLLYAGTEFGMFVSFDDGRHWQSLQLNLPVTPITDLVVHEQDLVVATQGRSFWILDDLTPLHQVAVGLDEASPFLFEPRPVVRSVGRGFFAGALGLGAPPSGAVVRYWLPEAGEEERTVTLEILDAAGEVLRSFESSGEGDRPAPTGRRGGRGASPTASDGINRFVWDLNLEGPETLPGAQFSLASTRGYPVVPGEYLVRLSVGETVLEAPLRILVDSRTGATVQALQQQFDLQVEAKQLLETTHERIGTLRSVREQVGNLTRRAEEAGIEGDWTERREAITSALDDLEEELIQTRSRAGQDPINFPPRIDDQIAYLYSHILEGYGEPTEGARLRLADLRAQVQPYFDRLDTILAGQVGPLNEALVAAGAAGVLLPQR